MKKENKTTYDSFITLKMKKEESGNLEYMVSIIEEASDLLVEFLSINSCSYAFNDLAFMITTNLKKSAKNYKVANINIKFIIIE